MVIRDRKKTWWSGQITPIWRDFENLEWINEPFNDPAMLKEWQNIGHMYQKYTGLLYDQRNTMPDWAHALESHIRYEWPSEPSNYGVAIYCMKPGTILPYHHDEYVRYRRVHGISDPDRIFRMLFLMEDWKPGHILEVDGTPITKWRAGDYVAWQNATPHMAANIGSEDRYTLQVTVTL